VFDLGGQSGGHVPPTARFEHPQGTPEAGVHVDLDASASADPDGTIVRYRWHVDGEGNGVDYGAGFEGERTSYAFPAAGEYEVTLCVADEDGFGATATWRTAVTPAIEPVVGDASPTDPDGDGLYEDVNGDGRRGLGDVHALFAGRNSRAIREDPEAFDFTGDWRFGIGDVVALFEELVR
jgi:PKD repeat protein